MAKKKMGRPRNRVPEKAYFGVMCTEHERDRIHKKVNLARTKDETVTISEYFLRAIKIRKGKQ